MNHVYFHGGPGRSGTRRRDHSRRRSAAGLRGRADGGVGERPQRDRQEFPGNPTPVLPERRAPAHNAERDDWTRLTPEALAEWRTRLARMRDENAEIIN